jgi:hypothetical protein
VKAYRAVRGIPLLILNLGVRWPTFQRIAEFWSWRRSSSRKSGPLDIEDEGIAMFRNVSVCVSVGNVKILKTWIFVSAAVRTANLAAQNTFRNSARRSDVTLCTYEVHSIGAMYPHTFVFEMFSLLVCHLRIEHPKCLPPFGFWPDCYMRFFSMCDTCVACPIRSDLLVLIIYFEAHKLWNSWCNCSYPLVTSLRDTHVHTHADGQTHSRDSFYSFIELSYIAVYRDCSVG